MNIQTVGVIGAGVIGSSLAQDLAQTGHQVILVDIAESALARAKKDIAKNVRLFMMFNKKRQEPDTILNQITFSTDYQLLRNVPFVIENVTENWEIKKKVYAQIDLICLEHTIFAVNTSVIPITRIASVTTRAEQVLGMHFMNPVPLKSMVEVIRGFHTNEATINIAQALLTQMNKEGVVVNDSPGFVSNRVMMLTVNEAIFTLQDQVATPSEIDRIFKGCFGHKMGPLETADLIGLDTILYSIEMLYENFNDSKYRPCPLLKKMVDAGLHGRKSGQGFYSYSTSAS